MLFDVYFDIPVMGRMGRFVGPDSARGPPVDNHCAGQFPNSSHCGNRMTSCAVVQHKGQLLSFYREASFSTTPDGQRHRNTPCLLYNSVLRSRSAASAVVLNNVFTAGEDCVHLDFIHSLQDITVVSKHNSGFLLVIFYTFILRLSQKTKD